MKALIAMSGGVDSSVAAKLMQEQGYDCIGCTMKLYNNPDAGCNSKTCCSLSDVEDARSVAARLNMPFYVFNYTDPIILCGNGPSVTKSPSPMIPSICCLRCRQGCFQSYFFVCIDTKVWK